MERLQSGTLRWDLLRSVLWRSSIPLGLDQLTEVDHPVSLPGRWAFRVCGNCLLRSGVKRADRRFSIGITYGRTSIKLVALSSDDKLAEDLLWTGQVDATSALFADLGKKQAKNFCAYLNKHRSRIVNYAYYQAEQLCSQGSGAVKSAIKQIGMRVKLSGSQWHPLNIPSILQLRCAYLNGQLAI